VGPLCQAIRKKRVFTANSEINSFKFGCITCDHNSAFTAALAPQKLRGKANWFLVWTEIVERKSIATWKESNDCNWQRFNDGSFFIVNNN
jgi:hypothetical protein